MENQNDKEIRIPPIEVILEIAERYLYMKEKCDRLYEKLTISSHAMEVLGCIDAQSRERVLAIYADSKAYLAAAASKLIYCKRILRFAIMRSNELSDAEKKTLLLRLKDRTIREIAKTLEVSDAAIVMRIKRSGVKLTGDPDGSEDFYNCLSRLCQARLEEKHERPKSD